MPSFKHSKLEIFQTFFDFSNKMENWTIQSIKWTVKNLISGWKSKNYTFEK